MGCSDSKDKNTGLYLGTEINEKWWRRYMQDGLFMRGNGEYWCDERGFYFQRYLTKHEIFIPFIQVSEIMVGSWHSGRWCPGKLVVKIIWKKENLKLSSGFLVSRFREDAVRLGFELEDKIPKK